MAEIKWKSQDEIDEEMKRPKDPTDVEKLQQENHLLKAQVQANADRAGFQEELIVEMTMLIYQWLSAIDTA